MFEKATIIGAWGLLVFSIPTTQAAEIRSADVLEFGAHQTLFIGDNELGAVHSIQLRGRPAAPKEPTPFNIDDLEAKLEEVLEARRTQFVINDLAVHPRSNEAIIAVSRGRQRTPLSPNGGGASVEEGPD